MGSGAGMTVVGRLGGGGAAAKDADDEDDEAEADWVSDGVCCMGIAMVGVNRPQGEDGERTSP